MTTAKRDEADDKAARPAEQSTTAVTDSAQTEAKRNAADAQFREDVAKAVEKRDKALAKLPGGGNVAETAWNETKADEDPAYNAVASDFRGKLDAAVRSITETKSAGIAGLEAFEARVKELLAKEDN